MPKPTDWKRTRANRDRAARGKRLVECYASDPIERKEGYTLADIICDVMHLAASRGLDAEAIAGSASEHFAVEREGRED